MQKAKNKTKDEVAHPFSGGQRQPPRRRKSEKVRFDKLYQRIQELVRLDSSLETETITLEDMARVLKIAVVTLKGWIKKGLIVPRRTRTGRMFFKKEDFAPEMFQPDAVYTPAEAAKVIKKPIRFIYSVLKKGDLAGRKYGARWFITREDLQDFFDCGLGLV